MTRCSHCGYQSDAGESECPLCGSMLEPGAAADPGPATGESPRPSTQGAEAAWDRGEGDFLDGLMRAWTASMFSASDFFRDLRPGGSLIRAVLYYLVFTLVGTAFSVFWNLSVGGMGEAGGLYEMMGLTADRVQLLGFFAAPFMALLFLGLFSVAYHVLVLLLVEDDAGFRETVRVLCYGWSGPQLFQAVPFVGGLVAAVWSVVLVIVGIREQHSSTTARAAAVVLVPVFLAVVVPVLFLIMAIAMGAGAAGGGFPTP